MKWYILFISILLLFGVVSWWRIAHAPANLTPQEQVEVVVDSAVQGNSAVSTQYEILPEEREPVPFGRYYVNT